MKLKQWFALVCSVAMPMALTAQETLGGMATVAPPAEVTGLPVEWDPAVIEKLTLGDDGCHYSDNLLTALDFGGQGEVANPWLVKQHAGEPSFTVNVDDGVLELARSGGTQPWLIVSQKIPDDLQQVGATLQLSAELQLDLHKASDGFTLRNIGGLYLTNENKLMVNSWQSIAEHSPNSGKVDWQRISMSKILTPNVAGVQAGFALMADGTMRVKAPELVIKICTQEPPPSVAPKQPAKSGLRNY